MCERLKSYFKFILIYLAFFILLSLVWGLIGGYDAAIAFFITSLLCTIPVVLLFLVIYLLL